jgi:hypothetical protein
VCPCSGVAASVDEHSYRNTGQFISPSGTTKTDTAERSMSVGRESVQVCFCNGRRGVLAGFTARGQS